MEWKISNDVLMRVQTELKEASPPSSISVFVLDDLRISLNYHVYKYSGGKDVEKTFRFNSLRTVKQNETKLTKAIILSHRSYILYVMNDENMF